MDEIILKPDIELLSKYYDFGIISKEDYTSISQVSYEEYKSDRIKYINNKINNIDWNIFSLKDFNKLLKQYSLLKHYDNFLTIFVLHLYVIRDIMENDLTYKKYNQRKTEILTLIKYYLEYGNTISTNKNFKNTEIRIINKIDRKQTIIIKNEEIIFQFFKWVQKYYVNTFSFRKGNMYDENDLTKEFIIEELNLYKKNAGRKQGIKHTGKLIRFLLNYLNNETSIKSLEKLSISNKQCKFIFGFLKIFGFIKEKEIESNEEDYIRTIYKNYLNKYLKDREIKYLKK